MAARAAAESMRVNAHTALRRAATDFAFCKTSFSGPIAAFPCLPSRAIARWRTKGRGSSSNSAVRLGDAFFQSSLRPRGSWTGLPSARRIRYMAPSTSGLAIWEVGQQSLYQPPVSITSRLPSASSRTSVGWKSGLSDTMKSKSRAAKVEPLGESTWRCTLCMLNWQVKRFPVKSSPNTADS